VLGCHSPAVFACGDSASLPFVERTAFSAELTATMAAQNILRLIRSPKARLLHFPQVAP
jgi:hypothetical protein